MSHVSKKLGGCGVAAITEASKNKYTKLSLRSAMPHNVEAFVFVAEFEIRLPGTNADVKYKSSL